MQTIYGSVDHLRRPYVRVEAADGHSVLLVVDTGVNAKIILNRFGIIGLGKGNTSIQYGSYKEIQLADLSKTKAFTGVVNLVWFGKVEQINMLVTDFIPKTPPREDEPVGLLGTELLLGCKLTIDFRNETVEITQI